MNIQPYALSSLQTWNRNYRKGDVSKIIASIARFGFNGALRLWQDSTIIAGNHTLLALRQMKAQGADLPRGVDCSGDEWLVPCIDVSHLSAIEAQSFAIADNHLVELGETDDVQLATLLQELANEEQALLEATGYGQSELDALLVGLAGDVIEDKGAQIDRAAELLEKWQVEVGDLWEIGKHRLLCGDSTNAADVSRVMGSEKANCMWSDPPYGVSYVGKTADALTIQNDGADDLSALLAGAFSCADGVLVDGASIYIAHPPGALCVTFGNAFIATGWHFHQTLVWVKNSMVLGHSDYHFKHEPLIYGWKGSGKCWYGDRDKVSVFEVDKPQRNGEHPTMKPVELVIAHLQNSTISSNVVLDLFGGSGTTMVACEQLGRRCRMIELEPKYCAVILERMSDLGLTPRLSD